jgi:hypothetical protein
MALVKCKECGEQVSTSAKSCPKCGAKPPKQTSAVTWAVLLFMIFVAYVAFQSPMTTSPSGNDSPSASRAAPMKPSWRTSSNVDQMTGKRQVYATSPTVPPTTKMDSPYRDVEAWLGVGCDGKSEWAFIGFTTAPNLTDTETESGYNRINTRIKWNDKIQNVTLTQQWGDSFLHFRNGPAATSKILSSSSALLELQWYGNPGTYFSFPLEGASTAVKAMRSQCAKKK